MKVLIIASGQGCRISNQFTINPKPLVKLLGIPLIERVILTAKKANINEFVIIIGYLGEKIQQKIGDGSKYNVSIKYVENKEWRKGNGISVLKAKEFLKEDFILLMSDHIFDYRILEEIINYQSKNSIILGIDRREALKDDTKVLEKNGSIIDVGKKIKKYNCVDTGIFRCTPRIFKFIEEAVSREKTELVDAIAIAGSYEEVEIFDIRDIFSYDSAMRKDVEPWWIDIDTEEDLNLAKKIIIENASKNPSDFLASYFHKPIENFLVRIISNFKITPNQVTILVNIIAYTATILFFFGYLLAASILSFIVGIVDGLDGKLARVKLKTSKIGSMEHSFDLLFEFSWFIALSIYLYNSIQSVTPLILCSLIILLIAFYRHVYDQFRRASGKSLDDFGRFERIFKKFAGRRNLYNIPILVCIIIKLPFYALPVILVHSGITAIVYASRALKHLHSLDSGRKIV